MRVAAAAAAGERAFSVVALTASSRSVSLARAALDAFWAIASGESESSDPPQLKRVSDASELRFDDPLARRYLAQISIEVIEAAIASVVSSGDPMADEELSAQLFSEFDHVGRGTVVIDPRNPPPPGPLEREEEERQTEDRELLAAGGDRSVVVNLLRARASKQRNSLLLRLPSLIEGYVRDQA